MRQGWQRGVGEQQGEMEKTPERELLTEATVSRSYHLFLPPALTLQRKRRIVSIITTSNSWELTLCQALGQGLDKD